MVVILVFIAFMINALMDLSSQNILGKSKYWNKSTGSLLKYKQPLSKDSKRWYHFGLAPRYKERFPYSTTWFVSLTDGWHLLKMLFINCLILAIFVQSDYDFILLGILKVTQWIGFSLIYEKMDKRLKITIAVIFCMVLFALINGVVL